VLIIGNLKDWDQIARLGEVMAPTLITVGRYDGQTIACSETLNQGIPDSQMVVFEESAHFAHVEETEKYLVVADFLTRVEIDLD
jgi:pimeloyl-ACP methyl ester carboxylesterase